MSIANPGGARADVAGFGILVGMEELLKAIEKYWGYRSLRPLQEQAMQAVLQRRDSLVVLPTGGGKSLCYQAPAVVRGGTTVVVSPLIALMKDQVDGLQEIGIPAVQIDSSLTAMERSAHEMDLAQGAVRLLFVSPERLANPDFCALLRRVGVETFAIDEAHCISHWGHDFRPDYRQLGRIKELFPSANVHAYTATATEQVRADICAELRLVKPAVLVGNFDRPNLTYRILPKVDEDKQVLETCGRHKGEPGIIYCLRRADVEATFALLKDRGFNAMPYHAGMEATQRRLVQDAFAAEKCDIVVATIAFGMGIDRSNIRYVLHTSMPKSIEHYQQETGRAGRDGLEAECVVLYSGADRATWQSIMTRSARENGADPAFLKSALKHLDDLDRYLRGSVCRHKCLVEYFGQKYDTPNCSACDVCLGDTEPVADAAVIAQKILSCVARVKENYGVNHVISVLRGENLEKVRTLGHDKLTTFGLLKNASKAELRDWIYQLIGQGTLLQEGGDYPVLKLNDASWQVMRKERTVRLVQLARKKEDKPVKPGRADEGWEGVDRGLFEELRQFRRELAEQRGLSAYIIASDATLRELAARRPTTLPLLKRISGMGQRKCQDFGAKLLERIIDYAQMQGLSVDNFSDDAPSPRPPRPRRDAVDPGAAKGKAFQLFREGCVLEDVMHQTGRSRGTCVDYLAQYIKAERPEDVTRWIDPKLLSRIAPVVEQLGSDKLKPIFDALEGKVTYDDIRLALAVMGR
jgi:ATP-dependent DNA helicase RecQ